MGVGHPRFSSHEIVERGKAIYEQQIRPTVDTEANAGKFLIIDIETGDYELDDDDMAATRRAHARHPDGAFYGMRVGYRAAEVLGGSWELTAEP